MSGFLLLAIVLIGIAIWAFFRGPGLIVPIPASVADRLTPNTSSGFLFVWRVGLLLAIPLVFIIMVSFDPGTFVLSVVAAITSIILLKPVRQALSDIWHFNFLRFRG